MRAYSRFLSSQSLVSFFQRSLSLTLFLSISIRVSTKTGAAAATKEYEYVYYSVCVCMYSNLNNLQAFVSSVDHRYPWVHALVAVSGGHEQV